MPVTSTTQSEPTSVVEIERLGFKWTLVSQYDLGRVSDAQRVQVREVSHYNPKSSVEEYAVMMGQSVFPPIVVTSDDWIIDGNTRVRAALKRESKFFPAVVLDVAWGGASPKQQDELYALAATLNQQGGQRLTAKEVREVTARFVRLGWKAEQIGRAVGVRPSGVTAIKKEIDAAAKLKRVGLDASGSIKGASLRALGGSQALSLNDVPYKELAKLSADAALNASEIGTAAKEAKAVGSDTGAIDMLANLRTEMGDRIRENTLTGHAKPPVSRMLRQHLGFVTKFAGDEQQLIETDPKVGPAHIEVLEAAIKVLTVVLKTQQ